jgi:hypothetical protein
MLWVGSYMSHCAHGKLINLSESGETHGGSAPFGGRNFKEGR